VERSVRALKERGASQRPQQSVNAIAPSNCQPKGVWEGRAAHVTAKAIDSVLDRNGCWISRGLRRWHVGKERRGTGETSPAASSGKDLSLPCTDSETFQILGTQGASVPEPASLGLLGIAFSEWPYSPPQNQPVIRLGLG